MMQMMEMMKGMMGMMAKGGGSYGPAQKGFGKGKDDSKGGSMQDLQALIEALRACKDKGPATPEEVTFWLMTNPVETHGQERLLCMDPRLQRVVMEKGDLGAARNPTAMLMGRCSAVDVLKAGDWICPGCTDVQFAKHAMCNQCQTPKTPESVVKTQLPASVMALEPANEADVQAFLARWEFQPHGIERFHSLDPRLQAVVMAKSMDGVRDPTAVLLSRVRNLQNMKNGDWICLNCADIVFARNSACNLCKAPKPEVANPLMANPLMALAA